MKLDQTFKLFDEYMSNREIINEC